MLFAIFISVETVRGEKHQLLLYIYPLAVSYNFNFQEAIIWTVFSRFPSGDERK